MNATNTGIAVALAVIVALGFLVLGTPFFSSFGSLAGNEVTTETTNLSTTIPMDISADSLPTELTITDVVIGSGAEAVAGRTVSVNYVGSLPDGTIFDASANHGGPFSFPLGAGRVIQGWDKGLVGMKVGGKRSLVIPPDMAYGPQAMGDLIPANSTLLFEVELVSVQ